MGAGSRAGARSRSGIELPALAGNRVSQTDTAAIGRHAGAIRREAFLVRPSLLRALALHLDRHLEHLGLPAPPAAHDGPTYAGGVKPGGHSHILLGRANPVCRIESGPAERRDPALLPRHDLRADHAPVTI